MTNWFNVCKHLVQRKGPVSNEFFGRLKRRHQPPFLTDTEEVSISSPSPLQVNQQGSQSEILDDLVDPNTLYDKLIESTTKALDLLQQQKAAGNLHWIKGVRQNFTPIIKMVEEVERYKRRRTMPLTWRGHTHNTRFF